MGPYSQTCPEELIDWMKIMSRAAAIQSRHSLDVLKGKGASQVLNIELGDVFILYSAKDPNTIKGQVLSKTI